MGSQTCKERESVSFSADKYYANDGGLLPGTTSIQPLSLLLPQTLWDDPIENLNGDGLLNEAIRRIDFDNRCEDRVGLSDDIDGHLVFTHHRDILGSRVAQKYLRLSDRCLGHCPPFCLLSIIRISEAYLRQFRLSGAGAIARAIK